MYLKGRWLVLVVFSIGFQILNINIWQSRDQQLQLLLIEDGNQALWNYVIEALQESIKSAQKH